VAAEGCDVATRSIGQQGEDSFRALAGHAASGATLSGVSEQPVYGTEASEYPGFYPYTRGIHPLTAV